MLVGVGGFVATAMLTSRPALFLTAGWSIFAICYGGAISVIAPRRYWPLAVALLAVLSVVGGFALLWPATETRQPPAPGTEWATLRTGSRLAYLRLAAVGPRHAAPVVFLHGGPGVANIEGDAEYLRRLAASGYDVYLYDQLGAGGSTRLADPTGYTLPRAVADLDAFREAIRAPKVDLIGYSWGSRLAAAYLSAHADHVSKVVFVSPDRMAGDNSNLVNLLGPLDAAHLWAVLRQAFEPRAFTAWVLAQVNSRAAHAFAGDAEMDARFRAIIAALAPALFCHPPDGTNGGDPGFYANTMLPRPEAQRGIDPHASLRRLDTPALIVKGQCDYLSWASAVDYRDALPHASMVYVPEAGHELFAEQPDVFFAAVVAFLDGRELPFATVTQSSPPPGYKGPTGENH
ncbi:alpha/beta hydrolase [Methylocystis sp. B8]|uniref:alpha/beta fold hydrolase n=1 Tax=Methylocystis sp. B8 TaxID=544938 RepID=UPI0014854E22|nr:alpha/beta hydrolase [Methylocystis sp. B8]